MASGLNITTSNGVLNHILGKSSYSMPSNLYLSLFTTAPDASGGGTEVSGNGYARVTVAPTAFTVTNGSATTNADLTFPTPTSTGWGTVVGAALMSASTGGTMVAYGTLTVSKTIAADDVVKFASGNLTIALS